MPTDKTNHYILNQLVEQYKDDIVEYEYKHWKESYLAPPPPRSYAQSMLRYRMCCKIVYIKLKDGSKIKVGGLGNGTRISSVGTGCLVEIIMFLIPVGLLIVFI
jgi:hypothetical protein